MKKSFFLILLFVFALKGLAQFKSGSFMMNGNTLPYQLLLPEDYDESKKYPLIVFLHGAGERGDDNQKQLTHVSDFLITNFQRNTPAIVLLPQCPSNSYWANVVRHQIDKTYTFKFGITDEATLPMKTLMALVEDWLGSAKIDVNRVYVGGLSMGGMGTLEIVWRMPNIFAAAFPICGGGDIEKTPIYAKNTAVWLFHGEKDSVVPVENSREIYTKLKDLGCDAKYTEYEGVDHNSWDNALKSKELVPWLFSHHK